jgi:hypothetical protein
MRRAALLIAPLLVLGCTPPEPAEPLAAAPEPNAAKAEPKMPAEVRYRNNVDFDNAELVLRQNPNPWVMTNGWREAEGTKDKVSGTWTREGASIRLELSALKGAYKGTLNGNTLSIADPFISGIPRPSYPAPFVFHRI